MVGVLLFQQHLQRTPTPYPKELKRRLECRRDQALSDRLASGGGRRLSGDGVRLHFICCFSLHTYCETCCSWRWLVGRGKLLHAPSCCHYDTVYASHWQ